MSRTNRMQPTHGSSAGRGTARTPAAGEATVSHCLNGYSLENCPRTPAVPTNAASATIASLRRPDSSLPFVAPSPLVLTRTSRHALHLTQSSSTLPPQAAAACARRGAAQPAPGSVSSAAHLFLLALLSVLSTVEAKFCVGSRTSSSPDVDECTRINGELIVRRLSVHTAD